MIYSVLSLDVKQHIANYIRPEKFTPESVRSCGRLVFLFNGNLENLKRIYELVIEYSKYNHHAENPDRFWNRIRVKKELNSSFYVGSPQLFVALSTGHWLFDSLKNRYTEKLEKDIEEIVEKIPESLHFVFGDSNYYACLLTPFSIACYNDKIPLHMIEFLINKGAGMHVPCKATHQMVHLNNHLGWGSMNSKRLKGIQAIFARYQ